MTNTIKNLQDNMHDDETLQQAACRFLRERDEARAHCERFRDKIIYWTTKASAREKGHACMYRTGLEAVNQSEKKLRTGGNDNE